MSILGNQVKERTDLSDEVIASNMLAAATASANAYLNATLTAPTPEFRTMCEDSLEQILIGHAQLAKLIADQGWEDPYNMPEQQLLDALDKSKLVVSK
ncbi:spore coat protein [Halocella sp. SP3-1]|uniref:spore coat protein n=1 Tax=Halocella sp. SP3-1 TaxID=2382161 RepID=UPI000F758341|nr:spore coat protein [Halocella sp. SP3-1]AZO94162.1 spore coat protein [Halocella sp. SP3-1]